MSISLSRKLFSIPLNWVALLAFAVFWSYGLFGALSRPDSGMFTDIAVSLALCAVFLLFFLFSHRGRMYLQERIDITTSDVVMFGSFFFILSLFSFRNLFFPLVGDALSHAQQSQIHGVAIVSLLSRFFPALNSFTFSSILYAVNIFALVCAGAGYWFFRNRSIFVRAILWSFAFLALRGVAIYFGGNGSPHPPFRLFPLWLTGSLFGETALGFRLAQFLGLIFLMWVVQRMTGPKLGVLYSWCFALAVGTIPVLWHTGVLVEQSLWTASLWTVFLLFLVIREGELTERDYFRWVCAISLFTLLRQSAFVALVPLCVLYAYDSVGGRGFDVRRALFVFFPLIAMAPFLLHSLFVGTSATYIPGEVGYLSPDASAISRVWFAIRSGTVSNSILNSLGFWTLFIVPAFFCLYKKPVRWFALLVFSAAALYVFYSIRPGLWGIGRYQAEYAVPFAVLGFFWVVTFFNKYLGRYSYAFLVLFLPLVAYNIYTFTHIARLNPPVDVLVRTSGEAIKTRGGYATLSEFPYAYKEAFKEVKRLGYGDSLYVAGVTYGVFGEILNGFTVSEIASLKEIALTDPTAEAITLNTKINAVLIVDFANHQWLRDELMDRDWEERGTFRNEEYGSTVFLMTRSIVP